MTKNYYCDSLPPHTTFLHKIFPFPLQVSLRQISQGVHFFTLIFTYTYVSIYMLASLSSLLNSPVFSIWLWCFYLPVTLFLISCLLLFMWFVFVLFWVKDNMNYHLLFRVFHIQFEANYWFINYALNDLLLFSVVLHVLLFLGWRTNVTDF